MSGECDSSQKDNESASRNHVGVFALTAVVLHVLSVGFLGSPAFADSWMPPSTKAYFSENRQYRLTVTPSPVERKSAPPGNTAAKDGKLSTKDGGSHHAHGKLDMLGYGQPPKVVWDAPMINRDAPVSALVSNDGEYVVTFDNWHRMGWGDDTIVVYEKNGNLLRTFALTDLISEEHYQMLPATISSIWWSGKHRISEDDQFVLVEILDEESCSSHGRDGATKTYITKRIRLRDGQIEE